MTDAESPSLAALRQLAAAHHIGTEWHDVFGRRHEVPAATLRALLQAIGVPADNDEAVHASLQETERHKWRRSMPPVLVVRESELPARITLRLPTTREQDSLELTITREDGSTESTSFTPAQLQSVENTTVDGHLFTAYSIEVPRAPLGYHQLILAHRGNGLGETHFIVTPERCFVPEAVRDGGRVWGLAVQLYAVHSQRNWGIGDFTDLRALLELATERGADFVGLNPLHALFTHNPAHTSPYSPSSRQFLNVLYLDPERIEDFGECEAAREMVRSADFQTRLSALRAAELVDYAGVAELKLRVLELLYGNFRERHLNTSSARAKEFQAYRQAHSPALELFATYEALQESLHRADPRVWGWPVWPEAYRRPDSPAVARFREEQRERIEFFEYLQWQADRQFSAAGERAAALASGLGLYGDLAVSVDRGGAESWANQDQLAGNLSIGAPPDEFNQSGQNWGLPPYVPERLREAAYEPFIALLRANMRHQGALRIDHVMGLERLYWVPEGASPADGAYVFYPLDDLLGIVALESHRNACLVVGEDLGTVSDSVREALTRHGVLSYRILYFERHGDGSFKAPPEYPARALSAVTTHDLPTLPGFWEGRDITVRHQLGLFPNEEARQQMIIGRAQARAHMLLALEREKLLPEGVTIDPVTVPTMTPQLVQAIYRYLARSPTMLLAVQLEDVLGAHDQVNFPGTTSERYPNWQRKLTVDVESLGANEQFVHMSDVLNEERPRSTPRPKHGGPPVRTARIPRATYRVQLNSSFTFRDITALIPYLTDLGISHVYCSPYFRARPGSTHGYDVVDHNSLNPETGDEADFERFVATLREHDMGQLLDIVPNHVGIMGADNAWWMDVLENGQASIYAQFFDIDWEPPNTALAGKVLVPVLGGPYGEVLESGQLELRFERESGSFAVFYHQHRLPTDPRTYPLILERAVELLPRTGIDEEERAQFESLSARFRNLPDRDDPSTESIAERSRDKEVHKRRLAALCNGNPALAAAVEAAVRAFAGVPGNAASFDALHALLEAQAYRLAYWRVASDEVNYRRFFDVNDLAALRMENDTVFEATHRLTLDLIAQGKIDGLRIDHPDGLYNPAQYFRKLQQHASTALGNAPGPIDGNLDLPLYLVIEKITAGFERVPTTWPVHGLTGYRFANVVNGLFVDGSAKSRLDRTYRTFVGQPLDWHELSTSAKLLIVRTSLAAELNVLANQLTRIARANRYTRDFTFNNLRQALSQIIACFPVYRTYIAETVSEEDCRYIDWALSAARKRMGDTADDAVFDFVRSVLTSDEPQARALAMKFQQVTAPTTAKGVEDTALYRFNRLVSLNEVGGEPDTFGISVRAFHADAQYRAKNWPHELLATSTHDTKRSEDVRARINVLSEMPTEWRRMLERWSRMNRTRKREVENRPAPSPNDEYLLYQTLLGSFPLEEQSEAALKTYAERIEAYMIKAAREAKERTSWANMNTAYEEALSHFVHGILEPRENNLFLTDLIATQRRIARFGLLNSLSQTLCKLTAPGVPDIYQGNEIWDFSLVDPDNRRPVDYATRRAMLDELRDWGSLPTSELAARVRALADNLGEGRNKLYVTWVALQVRRLHEALFTYGEYLPLRVSGKLAAHLCAYARRHQGKLAVVLIPRLYAKLLGMRDELPLGESIWNDTTIEMPRSFKKPALTNTFDGRSISLHEREGRRVLLAADALSHYPVALLITAEDVLIAADR